MKRVSTAVVKLDAGKSGTYFCAGTFVIHSRERSMISSEPSHCAFLESQKTALQAAMSATSQSHARRRRSAIAYHHQMMEMGL
jgi:hypothetical protein